MPEKRRGEQMGRDRANSQRTGKRHMSRHKAGESSRQGNRASLEAILEKLEDVKEELEDVKEELRRRTEKFRRLEEQHEIIIKQLDELKERADDAFLARRSELRESSQLRLRITSTVNSVVYKRRQIETDNGECVAVTMFDGTDKIAPDHRLSSAEVELVILNGAFNGAAEERWSKQEFEDQIFENLIEGKSGTGKMNQKKKKYNQGCRAMIKNSIFKLTSGSCSHSGACIMGNSNRGEFRLGVRLVGHATERVLEGISNPFKVQEYKTKGNAKHDIPSVDSEIWRLRRISRNSVACSEIEKKGIDTVGRLLISYHENKQNLLEILRGSYHRNVDVDAIIDHAMKCEDGLWSYTTSCGITLLFNQIETLVGVQISDCYDHFSVLPESQKDWLRKYESNAREHKVAWRLDYKMEHDGAKPWQPKGSNLFIEKHIEREGSSVPTSAQMQEEAQATIRWDEKGSIQARQDSSDGRAAERVQMMRPSAHASIPNAHNVQGEAGLGLANTGEPAERNSVMAYVPATYDRTRSLLNHLQPQGYPLLNHLQHPPFDCQVCGDASFLPSSPLHIWEPSVDRRGDGQFTSTDEDTGLPTPAREQYITPGFAAYAGQSSSSFAAAPYVQGQSSSRFTGTPSVQGQSFARSELQASYLGGEQLGSRFIQSVIHEFIEGSPQFDMPQQDTMDAYRTQLTDAFLSTQHTQWSPYPL